MVKLPIDVRALPYLTGGMPDDTVMLTEHDQGPDHMVLEFDYPEEDDD